MALSAFSCIMVNGPVIIVCDPVQIARVVFTTVPEPARENGQRIFNPIGKYILELLLSFIDIVY